MLYKCFVFAGVARGPGTGGGGGGNTSWKNGDDDSVL